MMHWQQQHDIKGPGVFARKQRGLFFGGWRWILSTIGWFIEASDSWSVWDETWCYLYPSLHLCPSLTLLSLWSTAVCIYGGSVLDCSPRGDPSRSEQPAPFLRKGSMKWFRQKGIWLFHPPPIGGKWLQIPNPHVQHTFKCAHRV